MKRRRMVRVSNPIKRAGKRARKGGFLRRSRRKNPVARPAAPTRKRFSYTPIRARARRRNPLGGGGLLSRPEVRYGAAAVGGAVIGAWVNAKAAGDPEWGMGLGRRAAEWGVQPATVAGGLGLAIAWWFLRGKRYRGEVMAASLGLMVPEATARLLGDETAAAAMTNGRSVSSITAPSRVTAADIRARIAAKRAANGGGRTAAKTGLIS